MVASALTCNIGPSELVIQREDLAPLWHPARAKGVAGEVETAWMEWEDHGAGQEAAL